MRAVYVRALQIRPCTRETPWSMLMCFDAFNPGSFHNVEQARKMMNLAFNFLELGPAALQQTQTWLIPMSLRQTVIDTVEGGWSACLRQYLRLHFLHPMSIQISGVSFTHDGTRYTIYAKLRCLLSDGEGLQQGLELVAYNGIRPCVRCCNVLMKGSGLAHRRRGFVEIGCADHKLFVEATPADFNNEVDQIVTAREEFARGDRSKASLDLLVKGMGLKVKATGLPADKDLRGAFSCLEVLHEDWMHGCLQDGTMTGALSCLLEAWHSKGTLKLDAVEIFLKGDWCFPHATRRLMVQLWRVFGYKARSSYLELSHHVKCQASTLLGLYKLLRHMVEVAMDPDTAALLQKERAAFFAACKVVDIILVLKRGHAQQPTCVRITRSLDKAADQQISKHVDAYGDQCIRSKHHRTQHIGPQIRALGFVFDAFVIERIHHEIEETFCHNTKAFETTVLRNICAHKVAELNKTDAQRTFTSKTTLQGVVRVGAGAQHEGMHVHAGDVVFMGSEAGCVLAIAKNEFSSFVYAVVDAFSYIGDVTPTSKRWLPTGEIELWGLHRLEQVIVFFHVACGWPRASCLWSCKVSCSPLWSCKVLPIHVPPPLPQTHKPLKGTEKKRSQGRGLVCG